MNEALKQKLIRRGILLTYEQWYAENELAFIVPNKFNPKELYAEYETEIINSYKEREI
jgi:hypothetical protein